MNYPKQMLIAVSILISSSPGVGFCGEMKAASPSPSPDSNPTCFNLNQKNVRILFPVPLNFSEIDKEKPEFGNSPSEHDWGRVNGIVKKPIQALYEKLLDPLFTRNRKTTTIETTELTAPTGVIKKFHHSIHVKPVFFITVEWEEDWSYALLDGTEQKPKAILISYQKTGGTSHIRHFCGNIFLKQIDSGTTGVYIVENIDADHRSPEDVYNGILGTLRNLRE
jgi:hypothetical protein